MIRAASRPYRQTHRTSAERMNIQNTDRRTLPDVCPSVHRRVTHKGAVLVLPASENGLAIASFHIRKQIED